MLFVNYVLSFCIPNFILSPCYGTLLYRVYRGSKFDFIKQIGWLMLASNVASAGYGILALTDP